MMMIETDFYLKLNLGDFPGSLVVKTPCFQCRGHEFNPGQGTKMPHAMHCSQKQAKFSF